MPSISVYVNVNKIVYMQTYIFEGLWHVFIRVCSCVSKMMVLCVHDGLQFHV